MVALRLRPATVTMTPKISNLAQTFRETLKGVAEAALLSFWLAVPPAPASRPRVTRWGGVYYGKNYEQFKSASLNEAVKFSGVPTDKPVVIMLEFICEKPKTGKLAYPKADVDNLAKGPLDALTQSKKFWGDDNQVIGLTVFKRYAEPGEEPGVKIDWMLVD